MVDQPPLFDDDTVTGPDLELAVHRGAIAPPVADRWLEALLHEVPWRQDHVVVFGRRSPIPRLQAWIGDPGRRYAYSGIELEPQPWTPTLTAVRELVTGLAGTPANSVLCNLYRDGHDSVAWHADDEPELGPEPVIASVSLGATRRFQLRRRDDPDERRDLELRHGDVIVMSGPTQRAWLHRIPRTATSVGRRVNLTFRTILDQPDRASSRDDAHEATSRTHGTG